MVQQDYFIGFDIGTDSVGWAVTDPQYKILKRNGKALWGVRLFDSAQTAAERRRHRTDRRRLERRKQRIAWLQEQFSEAIGNVDPAFFQRLRESKFLQEDKQSDDPLGRYTLFSGKSFCDRDYYREFPTIYHLRCALLKGEHSWSRPYGISLYDPRLVYLAVHHILKYRGHFLFDGPAADASALDATFSRLNQALDDLLEQSLPWDCEKASNLSSILQNRTLKTNQRKSKLMQLFNISKEDTALNAVLALLCGAKESLTKIFGESFSSDDIQKISLEDDFETQEAALTTALGDRMELILAAKGVYDCVRLQALLDGEQYLSQARVKTYQQHHKDLKQLKALIRSTGDNDLYREIFRETRDKLNNYPAYVDAKDSIYHCDYDAFIGYLKKKLETLPASPEIDEIQNRLKSKDFLPKLATKDNGLIPHQLHEIELKIILENAVQALPFLSETDGSGLSLQQRILRMFTFRVPYYVGPLRPGPDPEHNHSWVVRADEKIYPWNFDQVVDLEQCAENFITRMTAKCSYLGEDVLPKDSLLYSKFMVLNELNNLRINGERICNTLKQRIYQDVFGTGRKVTQNTLRKYLLSNGYIEKDDVLSGFDGDFNATLSCWKKFEWLLPRPGGEAASEDIIRHIVLFSGDKKLLKSWLSKTYGVLLTQQEQEKVLRYQFSGWGRLSREFLTKISHIDYETGEAFSIMELLWSSNQNLMELLSSRYTFGQSVADYRHRKLADSGLSLDGYLQESYASPAIKRAIHQTIRLTSELEKIMQCPPRRIFLEMARGDGLKGKRTIPRKAQLLDLYKKCGEESNTLFAQLELQNAGELRRDKLYLYYTQLGKCMYSGESIDLGQLDSQYDIDHIYPQSKTKDDSLDNRVLVRRDLNKSKGDQYPIAADIRSKMRSFWQCLKDKGLISPEKMKRLTRAADFSTEELASFINRQLVETRQSSKIVGELLDRRYGSEKVVYVKANAVSTFRQDQRITADGVQKQAGQCRNERTTQDPLFLKCREVNDFHHAKDAYLNIVVGNVYFLKFTRNPLNFLSEANNPYSLNRIFDFDVLRSGEQGWKAGPGGSIATVRHFMRKNNILFTRLAREEKGELFDQQIMPRKKGQAQIKGKDPRMKTDRYGGYNKLTGAYFFLVEHTKKKKRIRSLETVFLMSKALYESDPLAYCEKILELTNPKILIPKIKIDSLFSFDGFRMHISGRTGKQIIFKNANQLVLSPDEQHDIKRISRYLERNKSAGDDPEITSFDGLTKEKNLALYRTLLSKLQNPLYSVKYATVAKAVAQAQELFQRLNVGDQCYVLMQILNLFTCNARIADLKCIGMSSNTGKLLLQKNLSTYQGRRLTLIHPSVTGVFEQEIDLLSEKLP